ncbi:head-tail connector protein [Maritimibacter alkaliphilus]|uniref:head-tail connector protein n=1 Tax=Maritimibacter alkaliphilus TaxID=404236 RepID=UPI001C966B1B|nr:head-tail connector protein [Maritimibacter alkaliphilus]MBY6090278.1 head-tail connector protein [Maritimibacter alkaliphilus]
MLIEENEVPLAALPIEAFKSHLRLGTGFSETTVQDAVLEGFLRAALAAIEGRTSKALLARDFAWEVRGWQDPAGQPMPLAPVSALLEVVRIAAEGAETVLDTALFRLVADAHCPMLAPVATLLPSVPTGGAMRVRFTAGYSTTWGDLPADLAQAVLLLAAHYYEFRSETALTQGCMPFGVTALLERYRVVRLGGGVVQ